VSANNNFPRTYFILGLLAGLLIGIYVSLKFIQRNSKPNYFPVTIETKVDSSKDRNSKKTNQNKKHYNKSKRAKKNNINTAITQNDSSNVDTLSIDTLQSDILVESNAIDSSIINNLDNSQLNSNKVENKDTLQYQVLNIGESSSDNNDIHIAKNELIYAIYVYPQGHRGDFICDNSTDNKRDSLLINNVKSKKEEGMYVEFWRSPINYTGYKLSQNTLVLFGVYQYTSIMLKYLPSGILELEYIGNTYNLKCTDVFLPLNIKTE
jgi:hypothetical protein